MSVLESLISHPPAPALPSADHHILTSYSILPNLFSSNNPPNLPFHRSGCPGCARNLPGPVHQTHNNKHKQLTHAFRNSESACTLSAVRLQQVQRLEWNSPVLSRQGLLHQKCSNAGSIFVVRSFCWTPP